MLKRWLKNIGLGILLIGGAAALAFGIASGLGAIPGAFFTFSEVTSTIVSAATWIGETTAISSAFSALNVTGLSAAAMGAITTGVGALATAILGGTAKTAIEDPSQEEADAKLQRKYKKFQARETLTQAAGLQQAAHEQRALYNSVRRGSTPSAYERAVADSNSSAGYYLQKANSSTLKGDWIAKARQDAQKMTRY